MTEFLQQDTASSQAGNNLSFKADQFLISIAFLFSVIGIISGFNGLDLKSDGPNYFVYLRSLFFDLDLDFRNEYFNFDKAFWDTYRPKLTNTGYYTNVFSVGPALLWSPFYIVAHFYVLLTNLGGVYFKPDGFSEPYLYSIKIASLVYSCLGTMLIYKMCARYFSKAVSFLASVTVFLSTFVLYYVLYQPYMSHPVSYFSVTLFLWYWDYTRNNRKSIQWGCLGLTAGLMMLVRWQNGLFMIVPTIESLIFYYRAYSQKDRLLFIQTLKNTALFLIFALLAFLPQMLTWKVLYGCYLTIPQGFGFLRWQTPFISEILFSSRHGLLSWSPIVYLSALGWLMFAKRDKLLFWGGSLSFLLMLYVNSIVLDWWAGWSFGMRRFDGFPLLFTLGIATLFSAIEKKKPTNALVLMVVVLLTFTGFNVNLINKLNRDLHPGCNISFREVLGLKEDDFYNFTGYPFSFPANALFALKYDEPPSRYDTLIGSYIDDPPFQGMNIVMKEAHPFLKSGWSETTGYNGVYWRFMEQSASIYAPLLTPVDLTMVVKAKALASPEKLFHVYLNGTRVDSFSLQPKWHRYTVKLPRSLLRTRLNEIRFDNQTGEFVSFVSISFYGLEPTPTWK